jgi:hypothetical protein
MDEGKKSTGRKIIISGALLGAVMTIVVSLLMDVLYADALNGTWRDAIVLDLDRYFSVSLTPDSLVVYMIFGLILLILSGFGAVIGIVFVLLIYKFLSFLTSP